MPRRTQSRHPGGPPQHWRYAGLMPVDSCVAATPNTDREAALGKAISLAREASDADPVGERRAGATRPTSSMDRVVRAPDGRGGEMGFKVMPAPSTGNLATRWPPRRPAEGIGPWCIPQILRRQNAVIRSRRYATVRAPHGRPWCRGTL